MSLRGIRKWLAGSLLAILAGMVIAAPPLAHSQDELTRKVKTKVAPVYPDIARRMAISGTVRVLVVVTPSGNVKSTKVVGGHPLLATAATDAIKRWKFETASDETTGIVEFKFQPQE